MQNFCFVLLLAAEAPTRSCSDPPDRERGDTKYYFDVGFCVLFPFYDDIRYICCSPVTQTSPKTFDESVSLCSSWGMGLARFFSLQERDLITSIYCKGNCVSLSLISKGIFCWNRRFGRIGKQAPHRLAQPRRPQLRRPHLLFERPEVARDTGEGSSNFFAKKLYINFP